MESTLRRYAEIFDYFSSKYFFENILLTSSERSKVWYDLDMQIKRTFSINEIIEQEFEEKSNENFFSNLSILAGIDVLKHLDKLAKSLQEASRISAANTSWQPYTHLSPEGDDMRSTFYNTLIRDAIEVRFDKLYTNVILELNRKNYLEIDRSLRHISFILNNLNDIKKLAKKELHPSQNNSISFYINFFYGTLSENNKILVRQVVDFVHMSIEKRFPCLYIDVDVIIIKSKKDIREILDFISIPYQILKISQLIVFNRKKFVKIYEDGQSHIRGFPEISAKQSKILDFEN